MSRSNSYKAMILAHTGRKQGMPASTLWLSLLFAISMLYITVAQADGLFDFQMKLANKGNAEAQFKIGEMYETGFGVGQDMEQARLWINKAAAQGHVVAGYKLLFWDLKNNGVTTSNKASLEELKKLSASGDSDAQYYVGKMHAYGVGMAKNLDTAQTLLNKAAIQGVLEAERELIKVRDSIQRAQLAKRRAEAKRKAELKATQEAERRKKLAAAAAAEKARQQEAKRKAQQLETTRQANTEAERKAREEARLQAEREQQQALEREREARRQQLLSERRQKEAKRKAKFESDPCSGKSARFLSTCR